MFVVSGNYRNRDSAQRWLVREKKQSLELAQEFTAVEATNVRFVGSVDGESGFGCTIVAAAETAVGVQQTDNHMRDGEVALRFCGSWFEAVGGSRVDSCASLRLTPNGSMYAVLTPLPKPKRKRKLHHA